MAALPALAVTVAGHTTVPDVVSVGTEGPPLSSRASLQPAARAETASAREAPDSTREPSLPNTL